MAQDVMNIVVAGLGGQGVLTASDIIAAAAFGAGRDVKKAEVHGMSQRGGSVRTDVRFGATPDATVLSPMVTAGEADVLMVLADDQVDVHRAVLADGGTLITPESIDTDRLPHPRSLNVAMVGALSKLLDFDESTWREAIFAVLPENLHEINAEAFRLGRSG
ncbi:MAG: 2-oxoacid:acceptor oxidoreductase family protein [Planctomycetota bacterium]